MNRVKGTAAVIAPPPPRKVFRATTGLSLDQQLHVAASLQASSHDVLQKIQQMKKTSKKQKKTTKENTLKYEWLQENHRLKRMEETCSKELESLLLRMYNDACTDRFSASNASSKSTSSIKKSPRPEMDSPSAKTLTPESSVANQYASELEELITLEQTQRVALLKQVSSERDQRLAMKQLLASLQNNNQTNFESPAASKMRQQVQDLIFDAVIGHQMVEATLEDEYKQCEDDYQRTYRSIVSGLRQERVKDLPNNQLGSQQVDAFIASLVGIDGCLDDMLLLDIRDEFQRLQNECSDDLAAYERDFRLLAAQDDAAVSMEAASSETGGWLPAEDERFLTVLKSYDRSRPGPSKKPELLYDQISAVLPHLDRQQIKRHVRFHRHLRFYQEKCRDRAKDHERKMSELKTQAQERITQAVEQEREKQKKMEELQRLRDQCQHLHGKVSEWKQTKEAEARIQAQQQELERLFVEQQKTEEENMWRRKHELQKHLLEDYRKSRLLDVLAGERETQEAQEREEAERAAQSAVNAERVQFRQAEYERKLEEDRLEQLRREAEEVERLAKIETIKQQVPYAEKLAAIVADPERTRQETAAFRANFEAAEDGLPVHEKGLFPSHGYDSDTLFKNARFKLGLALRDAGLHSTEYARQALANIKVSNVGAYRHAVAPSTQLW
ncbi:hypothetical protein Poli38472_006863 [Pythium oligandrum]|uniref:Uncharacterized protein n=1 Tax=Pythium oligandrum TaxID=41045 RepID=A0A8K1C5L7_PYTOL|nr:hypothetical protein Poli38472_006863 [Pythium oligandrum]|eukprot:TMW56853.1 hypothetical protein Poli38472_006863 [Pythium oligandrum]